MEIQIWGSGVHHYTTGSKNNLRNGITQDVKLGLGLTKVRISVNTKDQWKDKETRRQKGDRETNESKKEMVNGRCLKRKVTKINRIEFLESGTWSSRKCPWKESIGSGLGKSTITILFPDP